MTIEQIRTLVMKSIFLFFIMFITHIIQAQESFQRAFGENNDEYAYSIAYDSTDKSVYMLGGTKSFGSPRHIYLVKSDSIGNLVWSYVYGGDQLDIGKTIRRTKEGGFIITGYTSSFGDNNKKKAILIKITNKGKVEWSYVYSGDLHDYGFDVVQTLDGGYLMVGETNSFGVSGSDILLVKTDPNGIVQWSKTYGGGNVEYAFAVRETLDGFLIGGETNTHGAGDWDIFLMKLDKKGDFLWQRTYGGKKDDYGYDIDVTSDGGVIIVGSTSNFGMGHRDILAIKTDKKGEVEHVRTVGEKFDEQAHAVKQLPDGGYIIVGFTSSFHDQLNAEDLLLLRLSDKLALKWSKVYGGKFGDYGLAIDITPKGDYYLTGETFSYNGRTDKDVYYIKMNDKGLALSCETARVQMISLKPKNEIIMKANELKPKSVIITAEPVELMTKRVLSFENIICNDNLQIISGDRRK